MYDQIRNNLKPIAGSVAAAGGLVGLFLVAAQLQEEYRPVRTFRIIVRGAGAHDLSPNFAESLAKQTATCLHTMPIDKCIAATNLEGERGVRPFTIEIR